MRVQLRNGLRLYVDVDGAGLRPDGPTMRPVPTLVLLHGGPGFDHSSFKAFFPRFARRYQLLYYDHRGMGRSDPSTPDHWNLETWADDLEDLLDTMGIESPILFGQSFGGYVALEYAIRHSDELAGLVVSSSGSRHVPNDCSRMFERLGGSEARAVAEAFFAEPRLDTFRPYEEICMPLYNTTPQDPDIPARRICTTEVLFHFWRGEHRSFDLRDKLHTIACPTFVVGGEEDPITPPARSREIAAALRPDLARLEIVPGAGHGVYRDAPEMFERMLYSFLAFPGKTETAAAASA